MPPRCCTNRHHHCCCRPNHPPPHPLSRLIVVSSLSLPLRSTSSSLPPRPNLPTRAAVSGDEEEALAEIASALLQHHRGLGWECWQHVGDMLPRQPNVGAFHRHLTVMATQYRSRHSIFVSGISGIHPFLLTAVAVDNVPSLPLPLPLPPCRFSPRPCALLCTCPVSLLPIDED